MSSKNIFKKNQNTEESQKVEENVQQNEKEISSEKKELKPEVEKKTLTVFGSETEFDGVLEFSDDLIITGKFNGKINATGNLEISKDAVCTVESINAKSIIISGKLKGDIYATDRVEICSGGNLSGDITTSHLRIANNVEFDGQITMLDKEIDDNIFAVSSSEYKKALVGPSELIE